MSNLFLIKTFFNRHEAGIAQGSEQKEERERVLREELGFRLADRAKYALMANCYNPFLEPGDMKASGERSSQLSRNGNQT